MVCEKDYYRKYSIKMPKKNITYLQFWIIMQQKYEIKSQCYKYF
jgi:hypothetical protein